MIFDTQTQIEHDIFFLLFQKAFLSSLNTHTVIKQFFWTIYLKTNNIKYT